MNSKIRILHLEDNALDSQLILENLKNYGLNCELVRAETRKAFLSALSKDKIDIILSDYSLPQFDGFSALALVQESHSQIPLIFVTESLGEEKAVESLQKGAADYISKSRLFKLGPAIQRILKEKKHSEEHLRAKQTLEDQERTLTSIFKATPVGIGIAVDRIIRQANSRLCQMIGYPPEELVGKSTRLFYASDEEFERVRKEKIAQIEQKGIGTVETQWRHKNGKLLEILCSSAAIEPGNISAGLTFTALDITERKESEQELLEYQQQLRNLALRMAEIEEQERKKIARTLHDLVGQKLASLSLHLSIISQLFPEGTPGNITSRMEESQQWVEEITQHTREIITELRPTVLDDFGLPAALHWYGEQFSERTGIRTYVQEKEFKAVISPDLETVIFRITQEAMTNIAKHSQADQVEITLEGVNGKIRLSIRDNGRGFSFKGFQTGTEKGGWGLTFMKERAATLGGDLQILSSPGKGTQVILSLPING